MNHKQAANALVSAYFAHAHKIGSTKEAIRNGCKVVKDVFANLGPPNFDKLPAIQKEYIKEKARPALIELVAIMMQPSSEEVFFKKIENQVWSDKVIQVNTTTGMGLKIKNKTQTEILELMEDKQLNPIQFGRLIANMIEAKRENYK
jgi:hypothetical protein